MDNANKAMKISPKDLDFLATQTDVPKEELQEIYEEFCEEFSDGKITKEGYRKFMGVTVILLFSLRINKEKIRVGRLNRLAVLVVIFNRFSHNRKPL